MKNKETDLVEIDPGFLVGTGKSTRGRRNNADRKILEEESYTYKEVKLVNQKTEGKIIVLLRLSTKTGYSTGDARQKREVIELLISHGIDPNDPKQVEFVYEVGSAWKKGKYRPVIDDLMRRIESGEVQAIYTWEVSRLCRNKEVANMIRTIVRNNGVKVRFYKDRDLEMEKDDIITDLTWLIKVGEAQESSNATSARVLSSHKQRAEQGLKRGGTDPFGFTTKQVQTDMRTETMGIFTPDYNPNSTYPDNMSKADVLLYLIKSYIEGVGPASLARWMNDNKIPTTYGAPSWTSQTVSKIIRNPINAGYATYKGKVSLTKADTIVKSHDPLISEKTYTQILEMFESKRENNRKPNQQYKLSGILVCGTCGAKMVGTSQMKAGVQGYMCNTKISDPERCRSNSIKKDNLESTIYDLLFEIFSDKKMIAKLSQKAKKVENTDDVSSILQKEIFELTTQLKSATILSVRKALEQAISNTKDELEKVEARKEYYEDNAKITDINLDDFVSIWNKKDYLSLKILLKGIFSSIDILKTDSDKVKALNSHQLKNLNWTTNLNRIKLNFNNGESVVMGDN